MKQAHPSRISSRTAAAILTAAFLVLLPIGALFADDGLSVSGYGRTKIGALVAGGELFMLENTLDARLDWDFDDALIHVDMALQELQGEVATLELRELYVQYTGAAFDFRIGKQQVIWGKSDAVFITDLVSPKDLSRFLVPDFVELRRAVTGVRANGYAGKHNLDLVWLPLFTPTIPPSSASIWAPALPYPVTPTITAAALPELSLENGELFAKYSYLGSSFDLSLMGGWFWNDTPSYIVTAPPPGLQLQGEYYRSAAFGYGIAATVGPLILRSEGAMQLDKRYQAEISSYNEGYTEKHGIQYLIGADFSVLGTTFGLQFIQDVILDHEAALSNEEFTNTATVMVVRTFARETLRLEALAYIGLDVPDAFFKTQLVWKMTDALELAGGAWLFLGDEGQFGQYDGNDSVFISAKLSF